MRLGDGGVVGFWRDSFRMEVKVEVGCSGRVNCG